MCAECVCKISDLLVAYQESGNDVRMPQKSYEVMNLEQIGVLHGGQPPGSQGGETS